MGSSRIGAFFKRGGKFAVPLLLLFFSAVSVAAQSVYSISGRCQKKACRGVYLTVYDGDSTFHRQRRRIKDGQFSFSGTLNAPSVALLEFDDGRQLHLYIEHSEIEIDVDASDIERSHVTGSRANSQYRYAMEHTSDNKSLSSYIRENGASPLAAYILFRRLDQLELHDAMALYGQLDSIKARCYHYYALRKEIAERSALSVGCPLPDFSYMSEGKLCKLSEQQKTGKPTAILFGASWCDVCKRDLDVAKRLCADSTTLIYVSIDQDPRGWDAPCLKKNGVTHLPYIILLDGEGTITARDVRIWELEKWLSHGAGAFLDQDKKCE